ncbi:mismatch-specific DNA-glycosylase [Bacillus marinisedimentorum]|uniref:mismatch-specific DNA-glycosylase n=1 Tax=Bacillus marinisedimentorum TaxID=1821260 RepID=UPI0007DFE544|nr:mismatch-specific DNA-glycosylase [Bacillus marinisedimentorum]
MEPIADHLDYGLDVIFVGFNPSVKSGETGHHYANPTNRFYKLLHHAGLTPRQYRPEEDQDLLKLGYGFTNIVARPTKAAADITREEYAEGRKILQKKIKQYMPKVVCFVGKGVYQQYSKRNNVDWGIQDSPVVEETCEYVAPSSSGLVRMNFEEMAGIYKGVKELI